MHAPKRKIYIYTYEILFARVSYLLFANEWVSSEKVFLVKTIFDQYYDIDVSSSWRDLLFTFDTTIWFPLF